jgi:outer membrane lipopolysaccharide assembly protein LptE/RlpB
MFEKIKLFLAALSVALLTGCGHNLGTVVHGKFINVGYDPEINKIGIQYVDGVMMTGVNKELSKNNLKFIDSVERDGIKTVTELDYSGENGAQVTGYQVDLEKARQAKTNDKE